MLFRGNPSLTAGAPIRAQRVCIGAGSSCQDLVEERRENQEDRIDNGIRSGKLNTAQTTRLEKGESAINHEVHTDRSLNGGTLTEVDKQQVNHRQNRASSKIYAAKQR